MKVVELLAPVGDMECLKAAVNAGADAVYLAGKSFGARALAPNFSNDELIEAVNYCHLYGVKIHITLNTLIHDDEFEEMLAFVEFLNQIGVDALIIQDLGIINIIRQKFPDFEIHASTQINTYNKQMVQYLKDLGVKRIVFAREVSLSEIKKIDIDIEKEIFIHGALCVSYSGQCLLSSLIGDRSGNRGLCAGPCRLPYTLIEKHHDSERILPTNGEYLLSNKDLCTIDKLNEILESGVDSLKIEGRMKKSEYVYTVISIYRKAIDNYYKYGNTRISKDDLRSLKLTFNRNFTNGFLFNEKNNNINNSFRPNHLGIEIGKVIGYSNNKVKIKLNDNLTKGDGIRFINSNKEDIGFIVNKIYKNGVYLKNAFKGDTIEIESKTKIERDSTVVKTTSKNLEEDIKYQMRKERKVPVKMHFRGRLNEKLELVVMDKQNNIVKTKSEIPAMKAVKIPVTKPDIYTKLSRTNHTPFRLAILDISMDKDIFFPMKEINTMKRVALEKLEKIRIKNSKKVGRVLESKISNDFDTQENIYIKCLVRNEEQLKACIECNVDYIYVNEELYNKYKDEYNNLILILPRINKIYKDYTNQNLLVRELGSLEKYKSNNNIIVDYTLNISNAYAVDLMNKSKVKTITLSTELNINQIKKLINEYKRIPNIEIIIYGNIDAMITKYCILNTHVNNNDVCNICKNDKEYYLKDRMNEKYRILTDNLCNNIIMSSKKINLLDKINEYKNIGIKNFRIQFLDESFDEVKNIINNINH